jgi:hypothetical protein
MCRSTKNNRSQSILRASEFVKFKVMTKRKCAVVLSYINARYAITANITGLKLENFLLSCRANLWMIHKKQQKSNGLFKGGFVEIVSATSQLELIWGPYMPVQNFQTSTFGVIINSQNYKFRQKLSNSQHFAFMLCDISNV